MRSYKTPNQIAFNLEKKAEKLQTNGEIEPLVFLKPI